MTDEAEVIEALEGVGVEVIEGEPVVGSELAKYEQTSVAPVALFRSDDPEEIMQRAISTSTVLMSAVERHDAGRPKEEKMISVISGRKFPKAECWTLLGTLLGVFPVMDGEPAEVEINGVKGWKVTVNAVTGTGAVVGRATALCMRSESAWKNRDEFALISMAQTRAASKALRQPLGFVMKLAGLEATPASEMGEDGSDGPGAGATPAQPAAAPQAAPAPSISAEQAEKNFKAVQMLRKKLTEAGLTDEQFRKALANDYGVTSTKDLSIEQTARLRKQLETAVEQTVSAS